MKRVGKSLFKKISFLVVLTMVVSIVASVSFVSVGAVGENMLADYDSSFEVAPWTGTMQNNADKVSGLYSMEFGDNGYAQMFVNKDTAALKPSYQYTLSFYLKTLVDDNINNKIMVGIGAQAGGVALGINTDYFGNIPAFAKKSFTFSTPANLDTRIDLYNFYGIHIWTLKPILVDDMSLVEIGPAPLVTASPTPSPTPIATSSKVTINPVTDKTTTLSGKTTPGLSTFKLKYGTTTKTVISSASGNWSVKLSKALTVGTKITLTYAKTSSVFVGATAPTVNAVTTKSKTITGKTYKAGVVSIKVGTKASTVKASSTGAFSLKLKATLKKGTKIMVNVKIAGQTSAYKTVTVK